MRVSILFAPAFAVVASAAFATSYPVTVKSCNREVTFDKAPTRAVSNDVNLTEMMLALNLTDHMVGYTGFSHLQELDPKVRAKAKELPDLSPDYPTREVLLGANADFYFAGWNYGLKVGGAVTPETLAPLGIKVYELTESCIHIMKKSKSTMGDMYNDILNLGKIFNVEARSVALVDGYKAQLTAFEATLPKTSRPVKIFVYDSGQDKPLTAGEYAVPTALIEAAGGVNIMDDVKDSWIDVGWESVVERNPDVIAIIDYGKVTAAQKEDFLRSNPALKNIAAVKNNRFVVLPYVEATPGPRNIDAIKRLAAVIQEK